MSFIYHNDVYEIYITVNNRSEKYPVSYFENKYHFAPNTICGSFSTI